MFSYAFYGYMLYNIYKYTGVFEVGMTLCRGVYYFYTFFKPKKPTYENSDVDWILIEEKIL